MSNVLIYSITETVVLSKIFHKTQISLINLEKLYFFMPFGDQDVTKISGFIPTLKGYINSVYGTSSLSHYLMGSVTLTSVTFILSRNVLLLLWLLIIF